MITTELYKGQGLGNQLACYIATRVIALDKGCAFGIGHPERFKGMDFLSLSFGNTVVGGSGPEGGPAIKLPDGIKNYYLERKTIHPITGADIRLYDTDLVNVLDDTKIDGLMQDEQYIIHRKEEIRTWLKVKPEFDCYDYSDENTCVINFRGGEYSRHHDFFLRKEYWQDAIAHMRAINPSFRFIVITDDVLTAKKFFPDFAVFHFSIGKDYSVIKNAHYLILSNSSFAWFPAWLNENLKYCIAPKYWARHNISDGYWSLGYNITQDWHYLDRDGNLSDYSACLKEWQEYRTAHSDYFPAPKIKKNFLVISNYNNDLRWVPQYTDNYVVYNHRSDLLAIPNTIDPKKVIPAPNVGYNTYNYFTFIIDNYDNLPEVTIFAKGWSFPRHVSRAYFERVMNNESFTPLVDWKMHSPRLPIAFFSANGGYNEYNNSWYLKHWKTKYFTKYNDFLRYIYKDPVIPLYVEFAPGGDYIVPKAHILKLPKIVYQNMRLFMAHCQEPGETHLIERAIHTLWTSNFELNPKALELTDEKFCLSAKDFKGKIKQKMPLKIKNIIKSIINTIKNTVTFVSQPFDLKIEQRRKKTWLSKLEIAEYRKKIKVYDIFTFFNELDLLEIRMNILDKYVDYFVIVEAIETFSGLPKKLSYQEHADRFKQWHHKIIHHVITDTPVNENDLRERLQQPDLPLLDREIIINTLTTDNVPSGEVHWLKEFYQKESIKKALQNVKDTDFCYVSDVDEIWNPDVVIDYSRDDLYKYKQDAYVYYLNNRSNEDWRGWTSPIGTKYNNIKNTCLNHLRTHSKNTYTILQNGGWHFTFQGGADNIRKKLESYGHQELNTDKVKSRLEDTVNNNRDIWGRHIRFWKDESKLPKYLLDNKDKYMKFFK